MVVSMGSSHREQGTRWLMLAMERILADLTMGRRGELALDNGDNTAFWFRRMDFVRVSAGLVRTIHFLSFRLLPLS
ncbi:hypothetical protein ACRALDRAFT_2033050 [Sodiomyces alcalophilus JCM 7366]|uniref:uncharacterized protein n=1 Tax=Sodiomyces alcalophilus JCM 7366 TaxID=591952 RepID=UPI0039B5DF6E